MKMSEFTTKSFLGNAGAAENSYILINYEDNTTQRPVTYKASLQEIGKAIANDQKLYKKTQNGAITTNVSQGAYVNTAAENFASVGYVNTKTNGIITTSNISSFTNGFASTGYVANAISLAVNDSGIAMTQVISTARDGLASTGYVTDAVSGLASTGYVTSAVSGLASTGYIDEVAASYGHDASTAWGLTKVSNNLLMAYDSDHTLAQYVTANMISGAASTGYVTNAISGLASTGYVTRAVVNMNGFDPSVAMTCSIQNPTDSSFIQGNIKPAFISASGPELCYHGYDDKYYTVPLYAMAYIGTSDNKACIRDVYGAFQGFLSAT